MHASLTERLSAVDTEAGRERLRAYLKTRPYPHFEPCAGERGLIVKINEDGTRTLGRFVNRKFVPGARD